MGEAEADLERITYLKTQLANYYARCDNIPHLEFSKPITRLANAYVKGMQHVETELGNIGSPSLYVDHDPDMPASYFDKDNNLIGVSGHLFLNYAFEINNAMLNGRSGKFQDDWITRLSVEEAYHSFQYNIRHKEHNEYPEFSSGTAYDAARKKYNELFNRELLRLSDIGEVGIKTITLPDIFRMNLTTMQRAIIAMQRVVYEGYENSEIETKARQYVDDAATKMNLEVLTSTHKQKTFNLPMEYIPEKDLPMQRS